MIKSKINPITTDIKLDPLYIEFMYNRNLRPETIRSYTRKLTIYTQITGMTPTELIEEAEIDEDNKIRKRLRRIKGHLIDLQDYLLSNDYSPHRIDDTITTVRSFYAYFEIDIPKRTYHAPVPDLQKESIPTTDDIKKALKFCNIKYQTIILLMSSSGISLADVLNLRFIDFLNALNIENKQKLDSINFESDQIPLWHIKRMKSGTSHITFNTPETTNHILYYLSKHPPQSKEDSLFRGRTDNTLRTDVFQRFLRKLNRKCGWKETGRQSFFHSHVLRKYFSNRLEESGMPHHYIRQLMGHRKDPLTRTYFSTPYDKLREEYQKYMSALEFRD